MKKIYLVFAAIVGLFVLFYEEIILGLLINGVVHIFKNIILTISEILSEKLGITRSIQKSVLEKIFDFITALPLLFLVVWIVYFVYYFFVN